MKDGETLPACAVSTPPEGKATLHIGYNMLETSTSLLKKEEV